MDDMSKLERLFLNLRDISTWRTPDGQWAPISMGFNGSKFFVFVENNWPGCGGLVFKGDSFKEAIEKTLSVAESMLSA